MVCGGGGDGAGTGRPSTTETPGEADGSVDLLVPAVPGQRRLPDQGTDVESTTNLGGYGVDNACNADPGCLGVSDEVTDSSGLGTRLNPVIDEEDAVPGSNKVRSEAQAQRTALVVGRSRPA